MLAPAGDVAPAAPDTWARQDPNELSYVYTVDPDVYVDPLTGELGKLIAMVIVR